MNDKFDIIFNNAITKKELIENLNLKNEKSLLEKYLNYWILYKEGIISIEIDKLWLKDDSSNIHRNAKDEYADTIFSVWSPLKRCIEIINGKTYKKTTENLKMIKEEKDILFEGHQDLYNTLCKFADSACKKGNVMEYPAYKNDNGNKAGLFQTRGNPKLYNDLFLISLYNCFEDIEDSDGHKDGYFSKLFKNKQSNYKSVEDWVKQQKLTMFFKDRIIGKDNIINIESQTYKDKDWNNVNEEEMIKILNKYTELIDERTKELDDDGVEE